MMEEEDSRRDPKKSDLCSSFKGPPGVSGNGVSEYCQYTLSERNNFRRTGHELMDGIMEGAVGGHDSGEELRPVMEEADHTTHLGVGQMERMRSSSSSGSSDEGFVVLRSQADKVKELRQLLKESEDMRRQTKEEVLEGQRELDRMRSEIQELRQCLEDSRARARLSERNLQDKSTTLQQLQNELQVKNLHLDETRRTAARLHQWVLTYEKEFEQLRNKARTAEDQASRCGHELHDLRTTLYDIRMGLDRSRIQEPDQYPPRSAVSVVSRETSSSQAPQLRQSVVILPPRPGHGQLNRVQSPSSDHLQQNTEGGRWRLETDGPVEETVCPVEEEDTPILNFMQTVPFITHPTDESNRL